MEDSTHKKNNTLKRTQFTQNLTCLSLMEVCLNQQNSLETNMCFKTKHLILITVILNFHTRSYLILAPVLGLIFYDLPFLFCPPYPSIPTTP